MLAPLFTLFAATAAAAPFIQAGGLQFADPAAQKNNLPLLKLPYGTWQAASYDPASDIYVFKNIRFAEPPVGDLRFAAPVPPKPVEGIQKGTVGLACPQTLPISMISAPASLLGGSTDSGFGKVLSNIGSMLKSSKFDPASLLGGSMGEDCLFLDIYVPGKALKGEAKVPVINWIYGGAYVLGSKDLGGEGLVRSAENNAIFVTGNYRLGAFGFLGGDEVEKTATPNAGFHDQRAVLQWIQDHIGLVGGDKDNVSLWGESAGGGSVVHQITAYGGKQPVNFKWAVLMSPAWHTQYDRRGDLETAFHNFTEFAGCKGNGIACLRTLTYAQVKAANNAYIASLPPGQFGFGPVVDGTFVRQHPALELASGNFAKIDGIINSHVRDEASMFVMDGIYNDQDFYNLTSWDFGDEVVKAVKQAIGKKLVSPVVVNSPYKTQKQRVVDYTQWTSFTCYNRWLSEAFPNKSWNIRYTRGPGIHGTDLGPLFYNSAAAGGGVNKLASSFLGGLDPGLAAFAPSYQSYLTSFARSGNPNTYRLKNSTIEWPTVTLAPVLSNVLDANLTFSLGTDPATKASDCDFWLSVFSGITALRGYMAPDGIVNSSIVTVDPTTASKNFKST